MSKIIRIEPIESVISVTWMLGARCNYDCMYCPSEWHDTISKHSNLDLLKQAWMNFYNSTKDLQLPYKISFTGGEATVNKSFLPFVDYLRTEPDFNVKQIFVTTNGSANLKYYTKLTKLVDGISFSVHSEFFNELDFFTKVLAIDQLMVRPEKSVHVNIMNEYWNQERISLYCTWLEEKNISYSINEIDYSGQIRNYPVTSGVKNFEKIYKS